MTKLDGKTPDLAAENIAQLRQIFPDVFEEGKIDFDKLKQVLGEYVDDEKERYNFTWNGKGKALRLAQTPTTGTLRPCETESKNWDDTQNLYIEGDNLEVLKLLQKSYHGKIKMIYIDPPYNTGGDFVYPDDFSDSIENYKRITGQVDDEGNKLGTNTDASGRFHTNWLNMMYPRLRLARNLLANSGVIFISIDDNEQVNLKKICDEVFGEDNYINTVSLKAKASAGASGGGEDKRLKKNTEVVFIYTKSRELLDMVQPVKYIPISEFIEQHKAEGIGFYYTRILEDEGSRELISDLGEMQVYRHKDFHFSTVSEKMKEEKLTFDQVYSKYFEKIFMVTNAQTSLLDKVNGLTPESQMLISYDYIPKSGRDKGKLISKKVWNKTLVVWFADSAIKLDDKVFKSSQLGTLWDDISWGRLDLQGDVPFKNGKKPLKLLDRIINMACQDEDIILDFFSGSATTAHAVMQLNAEDGGNRKFIMVQLPEPCAEGTEAAKAGYKNICEIGKERIRRAGEKIKAEVEEQNAQLKIGEESRKVPDIGFKVFKLDSSNLKQWQPDYDDLEATLFDSIGNYVDGRSELDVVYEIMLKMGMELTWPLETHTIGGKNVYEIGMGALMICLDNHITTEVAEGMAALYKELAPETWRVVFKDNGFADDSAKVNIKEILKTAGLEEDAFTTV